MQISGIELKEQAGLASKTQIGRSDKTGGVPVLQYQQAATLEKHAGGQADYKEVDITEKTPGAKSAMQLSEEALKQLTDNVTPENYSAYAELGLAPEADDPSTLVTVSDRIQVDLAVHCENYAMYGTVDMDVLKEIYGNNGMAYQIADSLNRHGLPVNQENIDKVLSAIETAGKLGPISEGAQAYLLNQNKTLTVDNLYMAQYSEGIKISDAQAAEFPYSDNTITDMQWEELKPQVVQMLETAGLEAGKDNLSAARWMVEHKIPVTVENIQMMSEMQEFSGDMTAGEWIDSMVSVMALGGKPGDVLINGMERSEQLAEEFVRVMEQVTDEELQQVMKNHDTLNMNQLKNRQNHLRQEENLSSEEDTNQRQEENLSLEVNQRQEGDLRQEDNPHQEGNLPPEGNQRQEGSPQLEGNRRQEGNLSSKENQSGENNLSLKDNQRREKKISDSVQSGESDVRLLRARRQMEEIRLMMTSQAGVKMLLKGIHIDTESVENIVKELKSQENRYMTAMFATVEHLPDADEVEVFRRTTAGLQELPLMPVYVLGNVFKEETEFTIEDMNRKGKELKAELVYHEMGYEVLNPGRTNEGRESNPVPYTEISHPSESVNKQNSEIQKDSRNVKQPQPAERYERAAQSYSAMQTQVRTDLGDSLKKAFDSVDTLLEDIGMEPTEISRRAVRILAYHQMEITFENVTAVKHLDMEVDRLLNQMTPKTVAYLIREGINPLQTNIIELNDRLAEVNETIGADPAERYSEYLWHLQKNREFSEEERQQYIGVYRLLNLVAKGDHSVIGTLIGEGAEVTMNNMLHALRSERAKGFDVTVDKEMGFAQEIHLDERSISSQLSGFMRHDSGTSQEEQLPQHQDNQQPDYQKEEERYQSKLLEKNTENLTPQGVSHAAGQGNVFAMSMEELQTYLEEANQERYHREYYAERINQMQETVKNVSEEVLQMLLDSRQVTSVENISAAAYLMSEGTKIFRRAEKLAEDQELEEEIAKLGMLEGDEEEIQSCYQAMDTRFEQFAGRYMMEGRVSEWEEINRLRKTFHLMNNMSRQSSYQVPVEIEGDTASVRVTVITGGFEKGKVTVDVRSEIFGNISAEFQVHNRKVDGIIVAERNETVHFLERQMTAFEQALQENGFQTEGVNRSRQKHIAPGMWSRGEEAEEKTDNRTLYQVAKLFIQNVKEWGKELSI